MAKNTAVAKRDSGSFLVEMPNHAPALGFDTNAEHFSWRDILPSNFWNLDLLEEKAAVLGGNPILTPSHIVIQPVVDPEVDDDKQDLSPKIVLYFVEAGPALVFNKTRCALAEKISGTPNPRRWADNLPPLELFAGVDRQYSMAQQILFRPAPSAAAPSAAAGKTVEELNDDLFAE